MSGMTAEKKESVTLKKLFLNEYANIFEFSLGDTTAKFLLGVCMLKI